MVPFIALMAAGFAMVPLPPAGDRAVPLSAAGLLFAAVVIGITLTLALLGDIERVRELVRGREPFDPAHDHAAFARFLLDAGCQPPPGRQASCQ